MRTPARKASFGAVACSRLLGRKTPIALQGDIPPSDLRTHPLQTHKVYVLQLDGQWARGRARHIGGPIQLDEPRIESGMSGSPILNDRSEAIGVISIGGHDPRLLRDLPAWLVTN